MPSPRLNVDLVAFDATRLDDLISLWRASFEAGVGILDPHPVAEQRQYFLSTVLPHNDLRVALAGDGLVGFVAASSESVAQLYVDVGWHRRGIGSLMLDWAKAQSGGSLWLYTFARNAVARAFYEAHGFVIEAEGFEPTWQLADVKYRWCARPSLAVRVAACKPEPLARLAACGSKPRPRPLPSPRGRGG